MAPHSVWLNALTGMQTFSDWPTFPQLYINKEFVGGCDIIMDMQDNGELKALAGSTQPQELDQLQGRLRELVHREDVMLFMKGTTSFNTVCYSGYTAFPKC